MDDSVGIIVGFWVNCDVRATVFDFRRRHYERQLTRNRLKNAAQSLQNYHAQHGNYPESLEQANLWARDNWGHPLIYSLRAGRPLIESLGRDGKRGGRGMDADLSNRNLYPIQGRISFWQRLLDPSAQGVIIASAICGLIGAALVYGGLRKQNFEPRNWIALGISLVLALAMAIFGAAFIALIHIPSGH